MAVTRCLLLAGMAFAVVGSCFMLPLGGRHTTRTSLRARGGEEVDVKVGKTVQLTKEPPKQGVDLLGLVIGGVVGLVVAAGTALQGILKEAPKPWHPSQEPGNLQPVGFFDPLNFVKEDEKNFRKFRTAEIKHGRVAMMAAAGAVVQHYVRLPGLQDVPSGLAALQSTPGQIGAAVLFAACGVMELYVWKQDDKKEPGNFGDPAKWSQTGLGGGGNWVTVGYRFPPGPSLEALEAFWNAQRSNPWFQNHPILSDPAIVELIKNDDVWQGDTQEERLRQAHVDFARECKRHRIRNRGVFPALKQLFWQSGSRE